MASHTRLYGFTASYIRYMPIRASRTSYIKALKLERRYEISNSIEIDRGNIVMAKKSDAILSSSLETKDSENSSRIND